MPEAGQDALWRAGQGADDHGGEVGRLDVPPGREIQADAVGDGAGAVFGGVDRAEAVAHGNDLGRCGRS